MAANRKTAKVNTPVCAACVLLCLTLISVYFTCGLFAKYTAADEKGDSARVISFGDITITESGDFAADGHSLIIPGVNLMKKAVLSFDGSEAAVCVFVKITLSPHWETADNKCFTVSDGEKTLMSWSVAQGWEYLCADSNGAHIYYRELTPNTSLSADIIAENGLITVSEQITKSELLTMNGIFIRLSAAAVQSGGFESPAAAWESVASKEGM